MAKKTGLGKGLDALFSTSLVEETNDENEVVQNLKVSEIEPNKDQPRRIFDEEALNELSDSIKKYGVIQPIIVSKKDDFYQIVAGERRWRASKLAGLTEIPAIVREKCCCESTITAMIIGVPTTVNNASVLVEKL